MIRVNPDRRATLRRLTAMVLLQAVEDARGGDLGAARWLEEDGMELALELGITCGRVLSLVNRLPHHPLTPSPHHTDRRK